MSSYTLWLEICQDFEGTCYIRLQAEAHFGLNGRCKVHTREGRTTRGCDEGEAQKVGLSKDGTKCSSVPLGARAVRDNDETHFHVEDWKISDVLGSHNGAYEHSGLLGRYAVSTSITDVSTHRKASVSLQNYSDYLPFFTIVRTVHDAKFCLSDQPYTHCNVSTIDTISYMFQHLLTAASFYRYKDSMTMALKNCRNV